MEEVGKVQHFLLLTFAVALTPSDKLLNPLALLKTKIALQRVKLNVVCVP